MTSRGWSDLKSNGHRSKSFDLVALSETPLCQQNFAPLLLHGSTVAPPPPPVVDYDEAPVGETVAEGATVTSKVGNGLHVTAATTATTTAACNITTATLHSTPRHDGAKILLKRQTRLETEQK
jgi:hypothetical protein